MVLNAHKGNKVGRGRLWLTTIVCAAIALLFFASFTSSDHTPQQGAGNKYIKDANTECWLNEAGEERCNLVVGQARFEQTETGLWRQRANIVSKKDTQMTKKKEDTLTFTGSDCDIDIQYMTLNPAGKIMPANANLGLEMNITDIAGGYKWTYSLKLPNDKFVSVVNVSSSDCSVTLTDSDTATIQAGMQTVSFADVLDYGFNVTSYEQDGSVFVELRKDYTAFNISNGDWLVIDPTLTISGTTTTLCGNVTAYDKIEVINSGTLQICSWNETEGTGYVNITGITNFTIDSSSSVDGNGRGYWGTSFGGDGVGGTVTQVVSGGAGHGGVGGTAGSSTGGISYGSSSLTNTIGTETVAGDMNIGSASGKVYSIGGSGGSLIIVNASSGIINIQGNITMGGASGGDGTGGGSGGEIVLYANLLDIETGTLDASGGDGTAGGGAGGGGRIKLIYDTLTNNSAILSVVKGSGVGSAGDGTIFYSYIPMNSAPTVDATATNQSEVYTNINIPFNITVSDVDAGDTLTAYVQPYLNGTPNGTVSSKVVTNGTNTLIYTHNSGNFSKHDSIIFEYWAGDGIANSTKANTSAIVVTNSLPATASGYTNLGTRLTDHTPAISWTEGSDADGDSVTTIVYVGTTSTPTAQEVNTTSEFTDIGNTIALSDGTTYYYRLRSWDGEDYSASYTVADEFRMNGLPTTAIPSIVPGTAYSTTAELMCQNSTTTDPDNDTTTLHYNWYNNGLSLALDLKNITNGNYSPNDVMICEIWVADPYETNTTKQNSSSVTITPIAPVINANLTYITDGTADMTPGYGETITFNANVTDADSDLSGVWFTLLSPNGTYIYNQVNGTVYNGDMWNSSASFTIDSYGSWLVNITANDTTGETDSEQWNFTVSLGTLSLAPESISYSQKAGAEKLFNITFSHTGNSNNTINITSYDYLNDSTYLTTTYYDALTGAALTDFTVMEGADYILLVNVTSNSSLASSQYISNITFGRTDDNSLTNFTVTTTISALTGIVGITPTSWSVSMDSASSSAQTFTIENTGDYALSHCNATIASGLTSYTAFNTSDFTVAVGATSEFLTTITSVAAGSYSDTLTVTCIATANNGIDADTSAVTATISSYVPPASVVGGGGGGAVVPVTGLVKSLFELDNLDQYVERYGGTITNIYRDEFRVVNKNAYDLNVTLGFRCIGNHMDFCNYIYFEGAGGRYQLNTVIASVRQKAGVNPGYTYVTLAHNATPNLALGNYTFFITATAMDGTELPPIPMVVAVTDVAPTWFDTMAYMLNNRIVISLIIIMALLFILFAVTGKLKRTRGKQKKDDEEGRLVITDIPQSRNY